MALDCLMLHYFWFVFYCHFNKLSTMDPAPLVLATALAKMLKLDSSWISAVFISSCFESCSEKLKQCLKHSVPHETLCATPEFSPASKFSLFLKCAEVTFWIFPSLKKLKWKPGHYLKSKYCYPNTADSLGTGVSWRLILMPGPACWSRASVFQKKKMSQLQSWQPTGVLSFPAANTSDPSLDN